MELKFSKVRNQLSRLPIDSDQENGTQANPCGTDAAPSCEMTRLSLWCATGAGKTAGVLFPLLNSYLRKGRGGIIIDVKSNLSKSVQKLARTFQKA